MPTIPPTTPEAKKVTPKRLLEFIDLGTGADLDVNRYQDYLRAHGVQVASYFRKMIRELTGFRPSELHDAAPKAYEESNQAEEIRTKINTQMADKGERRIEGLRELSYVADDYIQQTVETYFPNEESAEMNNLVRTCHDPAKLVLLAFDDKKAPKIKFEAARKLLVMKLLADVRDYKKEESNYTDALNYMVHFLDEKVLQVPEGAREGEIVTKYLVSHHEGEEHKTAEAEFGDTMPTPDQIDKNTRITQLDCRRTIVTDPLGLEREILFRYEPREKEYGARVTKAVRFNALIGEKDADRNGLRFVFASRADWDDFYRMFEGKLKDEIRSGIEALLHTETNPKQQKILKSRLSALEKGNLIVKHDEEDTLDGSTKYNGSDPASSPELKVLTFKLEVTMADGTPYHYEFQVFLPNGYADTLYHSRVGHDVYTVNRFYAAGVDKILFPPKYYPKLDHEKAHEKAIKLVCQRQWNGNGNGFSVPAPEPEGAPDEDVEKNENK